MEYKDYYQTLGVERGASADEIKKAYRKLVRKYHPDVSKETDADRRTKEINEAYDVLGDAEKRAAYDQLGRGHHAGEQFRPPPDWSEHFDFGGSANDIFADLFAHVGRGRHGRHGGGYQMRGEDIHAAIGIDLRDAYQGGSRTVSLRVPQHDAHGRVTMQEKTLNVTIPKGVTPGQYLEIQFNPDPRYRIEGTHVYENVPVTPWEAALGASVSVPTPSGAVEVTVPPGSQSGRKLRLKGRGIPAAHPGDLYLILDVVLPPANNERARELYQTMARELAFNPRTA